MLNDDEDMTPALENIIIVVWLQLIHQLVKQKYGSELCNKTLATLKPEISIALSSLLDNLCCIEDTKVGHTSANAPPFARQKPGKVCVLCKAAGRSFDKHYLSECKFVPEADRRNMGQSRLVKDRYVDLEDTSEDVTHQTNKLPNALI